MYAFVSLHLPVSAYVLPHFDIYSYPLVELTLKRVRVLHHSTTDHVKHLLAHAVEKKEPNHATGKGQLLHTETATNSTNHAIALHGLLILSWPNKPHCFMHPTRSINVGESTIPSYPFTKALISGLGTFLQCIELEPAYWYIQGLPCPLSNLQVLPSIHQKANSSISLNSSVSRPCTKGSRPKQAQAKVQIMQPVALNRQPIHALISPCPLMAASVCPTVQAMAIWHPHVTDAVTTPACKDAVQAYVLG
jgi:hypothetical protein